MLKISVVIPTYNRPNELKQAVESVFSQSVLPEEIIIVNDGNSSNILDEMSRYKLVKVLHNKKSMGGNFSRNRGAKEAKGDILMFLDDDDTWERNKIKDQIKVFAQDYRGVDLVFSGRIVVYDDERNKTVYKIDPTVPPKNVYREILKGNFIGTTSSVAIKRDLFWRIGGFDESLPAMQDYDLWIRTCKVGKIKSDGKYNVRYTISRNRSVNRISNSGTNQITASNIILKKYREDYIKEKVSLRKRKGRLYFYIAKSIREKSLSRSLRWIIKSFISYPSLKPLYLILTTKPPRFN